MLAMHRGIGKIKYYDHYVICEISQGILQFYYSLIPKYYYANRQANKAHITVTRLGKEEPDRRHWKYKDGKLIEFFYSSYIYFDHPYFLLKAYSDEICDIREKLLLPRYRPPHMWHHITIGNVKEQK